MLHKIKKYFRKDPEWFADVEPYFNTFGLFLLTTYPGFYVYNKFILGLNTIGFFELRLFVAFLGVILLFRKKIPLIWNKYKIILWYFIIFFSLPFFFFFLLLNNPDSNIWQINTLFALIILSVFVKPVEFLIVTIMGGVTAYYVTLLMNPEFHFPNHLYVVIQTYCALIFYFLIYAKKKNIIEHKKLKTLKASAASIAHEMRTPLSVVSLSSHAIRNRLGSIKQHLAHPKDASDLNDDFLALTETAEHLAAIAKNSQNLINILLMNLTEDLKNLPHITLSMRDIVTKALADFPYQSHEKDKVYLDVKADFSLKGNPDIVEHIFFTLMKNSFYFIHAAHKGEIFITLESEEQRNKITFKDTGPGIEKHHLSRLFTPFYSKRPHGTGIGLSFCKRAVESMGGTIHVDSVFGTHTTFVILFPK